jgi:hypothetical protein
MLTKQVLLTLLACTGSVFAQNIVTIFSACKGKGINDPCEVARIVKPIKGTCQLI